MEDIGGRLARGGKGAGIGAGLLGAIGAAAMGLYQAVYTGNNTGLLRLSYLHPACQHLSLSKFLLVAQITFNLL